MANKDNFEKEDLIKNSFNPKKINIKSTAFKIGQSINLDELVNQKSCCCSSNKDIENKVITKYDKNDKWIIGEIKTTRGIVPKVSTQLGFSDYIGSCKARLGINRMNYKINPGLYAIGTPDNNSQVLVSANYKLTFDSLRKNLSNLNLWVLILDTKGINVWCAAGKGTFGTEELINRINKTGLKNIVNHNTLILPQLGAPGVRAHDVTKSTGFKIIYGPIRAVDIKEFMDKEYKLTQDMRKVKFTLYDRLVLTPMELSYTYKKSLLIFGVLFLVNLIAANPFGTVDFWTYIGSILIGCVITPMLLPWIPGRAFAWKGWILGIIWVLIVNIQNNWFQVTNFGFIRAIGYILVFPSISAFLAMNFTGSSTYTSFSGVLKEMRLAVPLIASSTFLGCVLILINSLFDL